MRCVMLTDTVIIFINVNQWCNTVRKTLELNFISRIQLCNWLQVFSKSMTMSKENEKYDVTETPSSSSCNANNWEQQLSNIASSSVMQNSSGNIYPGPYIPNVLFSHAMMPLQNFIASNFCNLNFNDSNNYHMHQYFQQSVNAHNSPTHREEHQIRIVDQKNDQRLLSLREWENVSSRNKNNRPGFIFTLMCYNVLAQDLVTQHPYLYNSHDNASLSWNVRWNNIFSQITKHKPDILCLQEVQQSHIDNYFSIFETLGYSSLYKKRTGERTDGCAIYYKTDLIQLVEHTTVEYFQPNISVLNRDNVGLVAKFAPKLHSSREFVVATTHLLYNPRRQDVRLAQMQILITEIERISYSPRLESNYLPVILTGDLNSSPTSSVYEFITRGKLKYEDLAPRSLKKGTNTVMGNILIPADLRITDKCQHAGLLNKRLANRKLTRSEEMSLIKLSHSEKNDTKSDEEKKISKGLFSTGTLSHNFAFLSVYDHGKAEDNEGTTFQGEWLTVDYIFYSAKRDNVSREDKLKLQSRYRLPTRSELVGINIPNSMEGSDHFSLLAKFKLEF